MTMPDLMTMVEARPRCPLIRQLAKSQMRQTQTQRECGAEMNYESLTNSWKCKECGHTTAGEKLGERYDERLRFVGAT